MLTANTIHTVKGGEFIIKDSTPNDTFIRNEFDEEHRLMEESVKQFVKHNIEPVADILESKKDPELPLKLLEQAGEMGFLGLGVSEEYGGYEVPFSATLLMVEEVSRYPEFSLTIGVQTGIGMAPIQLYGNKEQKNKYLPKLVTGEWKCCYCLTEPDAGSDANSGKTRATHLPAENAYLINGQKMWITNAGIANIFIVFAKIEEDKNLSAFIVEKSFGGLTLGNEEDKLGIRASSTRQVFLNDVKVPAGNILGERGHGFKIALNVLNIGRIKLAIGAVGLGKRVLETSVKYANERKQFGASLSSFGAIKHKIAKMASRLYALEAAAYRTGNDIDKKYDELVANGMPKEEAKSVSVAEFGIECAINKVFGSEVQDFTVDEGVQIYGGMGFSEDGPMARMYRDSRISRIFEGTNEINRMLIVDLLLKKAMNGELDLMAAAMAVQQELLSIPDFSVNGEQDLFADTTKVLKQLKKATLMVAGSAAQKLMAKIKDEQEVLMNVADMLINVYVLESTLLKTQKQAQISGVENAIENAMLQVCLHESVKNVRDAGEEALFAFVKGEELKMMLMALKRFVKVAPVNLKELRREIADHYIETIN
jgi:alkylation response protein AidB-like acyl-CoA dehydrogenase